MIDLLNKILVRISNGEEISQAELLPYLTAEKKEIRLRVNILLAMAFSLSGGDKNLQKAKIFMQRAWELSAYDEKYLPLFIKIYSSLNETGGIKEAYKRLFLKNILFGLIDNARKYFDLWQNAYSIQDNVDKYEYDQDVIDAMHILAEPYMLPSYSLFNANKEKKHLAYFVTGLTEINSVLFKIDMLFAKYHDREKYDITFFTLSSEEQVMQSAQGKKHLAELKDRGVDIIYPSDNSNKIAYIISLAKKIFEFNPDLIVFDVALRNFDHYFLSLILSSAKIVCFNQGPPPQFVPPHVSWSIAWTIHPLIDSPVDSSLIPLEFELFDGNEIREICKSELSIPDDSLMIVCAGRPQKFQALEFWDVVGKILTQNPLVYFFAVGIEESFAPDYSSVVSKEAKERIKFYGWQNNYLELLKAADLVFDTYPSGGGVVVIDSAVLGIPNLFFNNNYMGRYDQTNWSPAEELVNIPELMVPRGDSNEFINRANEIIRNKELRLTLGKRCKENIISNKGNPLRMVKRCEEVYEKIISNNHTDNPVKEYEAIDSLVNILENRIMADERIKQIFLKEDEKFAPIFSIIVPTYNQAEYLGLALDSLLNQTFTVWEAILVNDGSTDDTKKVMEVYAEKDPRFKLFHKANGGVATALNVGIKEARGEWICWLSSDDMFEPDKLEIHYKAIVENPEIKFFHSHWYLYLQETKQKISPGLWLPIPPTEFQVSRFFIANYVHGNAIAVHKSVFDEVGLFNESMRQGQDFDMWLRISAKFVSHFIDKRTCVTRIHKSQTTNTFAEGGVLDSTRSLIRFLNGNNFEALFPFSDFNNPKIYPLVVNEIIYISSRKNSFIYRCGYTTALVEKTLEWITNKVPEKYKKVLFDMLMELVQNAITNGLDNEIKTVVKKFLDRKKVTYIKHDFIEDTIEYIKYLAVSGDQRTCAAIEKYLLNIISTNSEPGNNLKKYTPLLLSYPKDDIYKQLNVRNILKWYIAPGGMADNLVKHEMEIHCPVCENNFKVIFDYEMTPVPSSARFICTECKTGYEFTDKNLDEDFVVFNKNKVKDVETQTPGSSVAFLIHDATYIGGGTKVVFKHIDWLLKLGCKVTVYSFAKKPDWVKIKVDFVVIKSEEEIDHKLADLFVVFSIFDLPSMLNKVPIDKIVHLCQGYEGYHFGRNYEELRSDKHILTMLHAIPVKNISVSSHLTNLFIQKFNRVSQYIPNSINHKIFSFSEYKSKEEKSVLFIGNPMHPLKGFQFLATALKVIRNSDTGVKKLKITIVVGIKYENEKQIKELISNETGCSVSIKSKLESKEIAALIKESSVVVCSSWYEGFSLPLLEAMASGVPVITTNNMGAESFCADNKNSFVVQFGDLKTLASNLMRIFYPDAGLKKILQNAFKTSLEYSELNSAKHLITSYQNLLGSPFAEKCIEELLNEINPQHLLSKTGISSDKNISVIIPVYNNAEYTKKCIESLFKYTPNLAELIIIDNASTDNTQEYLFNLQSHDSRLIVITNENNLGFPGAVNQGLSKFTSAYAVIANNDIVFTAGWAEGLINLAESDAKIGIAGPMANSVSGVQLDKNAQYKTMEDMHKYAAALKKNKKNKWFQFPRVAFLCTLIKREVIEKLGGLDERFSPGNFEDDDFCLRAQLAGYKTVIAEDVFIHHFGSKSFTANGIDKYKERLEINRQIFIDKWGGDPEEIWLKGKEANNRNFVYSINENDFTRFFERAQIQVQEKDYLLALSSFESAIASYSEEKTHSSVIELPSLLNLTGNVAILAGELEIAQKYFEIALNTDPLSSFACSGLGEVFFKQEQYESAKIMYEWGVRNNPDNIIAVDGLKRVNHLLGITDNGSEDYLSPEQDVVKLLETAYSLFEEKKFDEVLETLIIAEKLLPENDMKIRSALESLRGFSYLGLNNYMSAKLYFERALYDEPDSSDACAGLAEVFFLTGFEKEAKTMFEWAVAYNPGNKFAKAGLSKVNGVLGFEEYHNSLIKEYN